MKRSDEHGQVTLSDLIDVVDKLLQCMVELNEDLTDIANSLNSFYEYVHDIAEAEASETSEGDK